MKTTQLGLTVLGLLLAAACSKPQAESTAVQETSVQPPAEVTGTAFDCEGVQLLARFDEGSVTLDLDGGKVALPRVDSESGEKYSDGTTTFSTQGDEATLERASGTSSCVLQPVRSVEATAKAAETGESAGEPKAGGTE